MCRRVPGPTGQHCPQPSARWDAPASVRRGGRRDMGELTLALVGFARSGTAATIKGMARHSSARHSSPQNSSAQHGS